MYESRDELCYKGYAVTISDFNSTSTHCCNITPVLHYSAFFLLVGQLQEIFPSCRQQLKNKDELTARDVRRSSCVDVAHWIKITKHKIRNKFLNTNPFYSNDTSYPISIFYSKK